MIGQAIQVALEPPRGEVSTRLVDALGAALGRPARTVIAPDAAPDSFWFSASDVHNLCPRLFALALRDGLAFKDAVDADLVWTFAVGTGYHRAFQDELLHALGDVFQGCWERTERGQLEYAAGANHGPYTERGWGPKPEGDRWRFVEPKGRVPHARLVGKWDGVLAWPDAPPEVFELKSIREDLFPTVDARVGGRPKPDHVLQCQAYLWMSGLDWARLVYVAKGSGDLRACVAEHIIPRDDGIIRDMEASLAACCAALDGVATAQPLPTPLAACRIKSDARARRCACKAECFDARRAAK